MFTSNDSTLTDENLHDAFEVCLSALKTGVTPEACLSLYPDLAAELAPMVHAAALAAQAAHPMGPSSLAVSRSRAKLLRRADQLNHRRRSFFSTRRLVWTALSLFLVIFLSLNGLVGASAKSLPGDTLYPVKRAAEQVRLQIVADSELRHQMEVEYTHRRTSEVNQLLSMNRIEKISMEGMISEITQERWVINQIPVAVSPDTIMIGHPGIGKIVEVEGYTQTDGLVDAHEIHLRYYEMSGTITEINLDHWKIGSETFIIQPGAQIDPSLAVGDSVLVLIYSSDDGNQYAQAIVRHTPAFTPFEIEFSGELDSVTEDAFIISGKTVLLTAKTQVQGDIRAGQPVQVQALVTSDGMQAISIIFNQPSGSSPENSRPADLSSSTVDEQPNEAQSEDQYSGIQSIKENDSVKDDSSQEDNSQFNIKDQNDSSSEDNHSREEDHHSEDDSHQDDGEHDSSGTGD